MSFSDLPEDLIEYIFLQLSPYGEHQSIRLVSRKWNRLAKGAAIRLRKLFHRCDSFEWFLLIPHPDEGGKYKTGVAERCSHAAAYHSQIGSLFVFGGCTAAYTTFNDLWKLDLASRAWIRPIPMGNYPSPKACATMVEYGGRLVLFGGWAKSSPNPIHQTAMFFNELHVYDPVTNDWRSLENDGSAPHLAGHSATVIKDRMIVFGGSHGSGSSSNVWVFNFLTQEWSTPATTTPKPLARYGQSQLVLDDTHILIVGGCGGPNLIFSDAWLLTINTDEEWTWEEIRVTNPRMAAPQLWSHPGCKVGNKLVVLSKPYRAESGRGGSMQRSMSSSPRPNTLRARTEVPSQGNLIPPRRKLISSRSLDEQNPPPSPKSVDRKIPELQRARSIPAIIVGEIPKLVVTNDDNSGDSSSSDSSSGAPGSVPDDVFYEGASRSSPYIAMVGSSLLPNQATQIQLPPVHPPSEAAGSSRGKKQSSPPKVKDRAHPSVKPNASNNREKQLQMLRRMEEYIRSRSHAQEAAAAAASSSGGSACSSGPGSPGSPKIHFRPSSPPPKSKHNRPASFLLSKNPMNVYILELDKVLDQKSLTWSILEDNFDAPEDTILYSLVKGRGELIMFGGMRSSNASEQQGLDVTPFSHTITNETYILRPSLAL